MTPFSSELAEAAEKFASARRRNAIAEQKRSYASPTRSGGFNQYSLKYHARDGYIAGARWTLENEVVRDLREALADVIRNSPDIVAKKVCSRALEAYKQAMKGAE